MSALRALRFVGAVTVLASIPALLALAAHAQTSPTPSDPQKQGTVTPPAPGSPTSIPEVIEKTPPPSPARATVPSPSETVTAPAPALSDVTIGTAVFGSDGKKVGDVKQVKAQGDGALQEIVVESGGFLGFGAKNFVVPASKISKGGLAVQLSVSSTEFEALPQVKDAD